MGIFLDNKKALFLPRPAQARVVEQLNGSFLQVVGPVQEVEISPEKLINEFSGIKKPRDVEAFAYKYGRLDYGPANEDEDVLFWLAVAHLARKILDLRKAFIKRKPLLEIIGVNDTHFVWLDGNIQMRTTFHDLEEDSWLRGKRAKLQIYGDDLEESNLRMLTPILIKNEILPFLDVRINFNEIEIISDLNWGEGDEYTLGNQIDENNTRYVLKKREYAPTLLSAIFHALWVIVNDNRDIMDCADCGRSIVIRRQRENAYCGPACKKRAERARKENG